MNCPKCGTASVEVARFCYRCGEHLAGSSRRRHYAASGHEPVASVSVVSTVMPHGVAHSHHHYRIALALGVGVPLVAAVLGFVSFAMIAAAIAVPLVYLVYLYDVDVWEEQPLPVVAACGLLTIALSAGWSLLWPHIHDSTSPAATAGSTYHGSDLATVGVLVAAVGLLLALVGPLLLLRLPKYDDLMDGLVLGFTAGSVLAGTATVVLNRDLLSEEPGRLSHVNAGLWLGLVAVRALVLPLVFGLAAGLAAAEFAGTAPGPGRVSARFARGLAEALGAVVVLGIGVYLLGLVGSRSEATGPLLGLAWGLAVAAVLVLRVRLLVHDALLEAALEAASAGHAGQHATVDGGHCANCHLLLVDGALFCSGCGTSVRALPKQVRRANTAPGAGPPAAAGDEHPTRSPAPEGAR